MYIAAQLMMAKKFQQPKIMIYSYNHIIYIYNETEQTTAIYTM